MCAYLFAIKFKGSIGNNLFVSARVRLRTSDPSNSLRWESLGNIRALKCCCLLLTEKIYKLVQRPPVVGMLTRHDFMPEHILNLHPSLVSR